MAPHRRLSDDELSNILSLQSDPKKCLKTDVFIAGSGPVGCTYARTIIDDRKAGLNVVMAEIGAQEGPVPGTHQKNAIKYQKDIDSFTYIVKAALQAVSTPPEETYIPTLGGDGWTWAPTPGQDLVFRGANPKQKRDVNLKASGITRTVGGMATHWTASCPFPHKEERVENPILEAEFDTLLQDAYKLLNVHEHEYDHSIRHTVVKEKLLDSLPTERGVTNLHLGVERREDNPAFVTWTGSDTILGDTYKDPRFKLLVETRVTRFCVNKKGEAVCVEVKDLGTKETYYIFAKAYVVCCGAICTPQILANSGLGGPALGRNLCEQSIAFCQIVLKREIVDKIWTDKRFKERVDEHHSHHPLDPLPIPFGDPEPQVMIPYTTKAPWHVQVHRDAFSYGDVGPRADSRVVVDLRWFGKQDIDYKNMVYFGPHPNRSESESDDWSTNTDLYGLPQPTFEVERSNEDILRDHRMMKDMTDVANHLGAYLPGSQPQFMEPGLALHITGTTRIGTKPQTSVANPSSRLHDAENIWVGGNGNIPDSMACNTTLTSVAIALKGAKAVIEYVNTKKGGPSP